MSALTWSHATSVSSSASSTSDVINLRRHETYACIQVAWTGTTAGTLKLQVSNDSTQWDDLDGITVTPAGSDSQDLWVIYAASFQFMRVVFTRTSGTGTLTGTVSLKEVN
jgi:hypothetical protein